MLYKRFSFFLFLIWSTQTLAMNNPGVHDDIKQIETLVIKLREIDPSRFDHRRASQLLMAEHLDFLERPEDISRLYRNARYITTSANGCSHIWEATLAEDRPLAGLKAGDVIAIKMEGCIPKPFKNSLGSVGEIESLTRLSHFKNPKTGEWPITDYFPNFYGVYYAEKMPLSVVAGQYPEDLKNYKSDKSYFRYEEMEWIDTTFDKKYGNSKIPDPVLFELMYGEWAGQFFMGLSIGDCKGDNYGLKTVSYKRIYHLGEDVYSFSSTETPIRLDLEMFRKYPHPTQKRFNGGRIKKSGFAQILNDSAETQNGKCFLDELCNRKDDIFALFKKYFYIYQINPISRDQLSEGKNFYLDQKWIDQERALSIPKKQL